MPMHLFDSLLIRNIVSTIFLLILLDNGILDNVSIIY